MAVAFLSVLLSMQVYSNALQLTPNNPLSKYIWQKRVVLVFMPSDMYQPGKMQLHKFQEVKSEFIERDIVLIPVIGNIAKGGKGNTDDAHALRRQFKVQSKDFRIILIGKDGNEKYRSLEVINPSFIFNLIDAMPMRQSEINKKNKL